MREAGQGQCAWFPRISPLTPAPLSSQGCFSTSIPGSLRGLSATFLPTPGLQMGGPSPQLIFKGFSWVVRHPLACGLAGQLPLGPGWAGLQSGVLGEGGLWNAALSPNIQRPA